MRTRKGSESDTQEKLRLILSAVEHARDAIVITTAGLAPPEPAIVYANPAFETLTGWRREELLGRSPRILQGPKTDRSVLDALKRALSRGVDEFSARAVNYRKDGTEYSVEWTISPIRDGARAITHWVAVQRDASDRMGEEDERRRIEERQEKLQQAISRSALEWRLTFDSIASPLLLVETSGRIIRMNEAARTLAGVSYDDAVHHPLSVLGDREPWPAVQGLAARVAASAVRATAQVGDEAGGTWDVSVNPVAGPQGDRWLIVVALDITNLVKLQESLRRSETMSAMGALVAGVAHEVRNPLFGISATLDAFESRFKSRTEYRRYFDVLKERVQRLNELMQQLLDYGKPLRLELTEASARELTQAAVHACAPLAAATRVEVAEEIAGSLPTLTVDRARVVQVFENLLENAIQHSSPGGQVTLRAESADGGGGVRFFVEDSGPGFRPEDLARVFEPFFTRRRGGTGLGLSIVQRIVEQHEGEIAAGNRPGGGAVMTVVLPPIPKNAGAERF
ncbi:MAG TPA: ATP-binding protein [Thermoanaerobaculia bacterium]|nr:ATP-binding protein [Thermoanaerobaculia bacterium]